MGVESVREVVINDGDPGSLKKKWAEVFAPYGFSSGGLMEMGEGPAVRIGDGEKNVVGALVFVVTSIEKARGFLERNSLLGASSAGELRIDPAKVQGLDIRIVKK